MLAYIGFTQAMMGPLMPFLRTELGLSYTLGGMLPAAMAVGLICSGLISDRLAHRWGRRFVFWSGGVGLAAAAILLGLSHQFEWLITAALGMGFASSLTQIMIQAVLADRHGEQRATAITEANVAASLSIALTPLVIGVLQYLSLGWRAVTFLPVLMLALVAAPFFRQPILGQPVIENMPGQSPGRGQLPGGGQPQAGQADAQRPGRLPPPFWLYWIALLMIVSIEMSLAVWATDFLSSVVGLGQDNAVLAFGIYPAAMLVGRIAGSRLTQRWPGLKLLLAALGVVLIGFPIFWLSRLAALNILGLFICGLGMADHALLLDCRSRQYEQIPFKLEHEVLVIMNTQVKHEIGSSEYPVRQRQCLEGLTVLQQKHSDVRSLRDVTPMMLKDAQDRMKPLVFDRCWHVVTEIERTTRATQALRNQDLTEFGHLMIGSHQSLSAKYEVSCPELDAIVEVARSVDGVYGARMTGGGFGGCAIALVASEAENALRAAVLQKYNGRFAKPAIIYTTKAENGAAVSAL